MADVFLIIVSIIVILILFVLGVYFIVYYQHPDDHNESYFPKFVVLFGLVIAGCTVFLFPLDAANNGNYPGCAGFDTKICGGLNMTALWNMVFWLIPIWVFFMIPFATFYYEADDGLLMAGTAYAPNAVKKSRLAQAACYQLYVFVIMGILFIVGYMLLSDTKVPVRQFTGKGFALLLTDPDYVNKIPIELNTTTNETLPFSPNYFANMSAKDELYRKTVVEDPNLQYMTLQVSVSTFFAAIMAWIGWFFFALFGGIGLAAMPLDLIMLYVNRPKHMDAAEFAEVQLSLRERTNELVDIGEMIKIEREQKAVAGQLNAFSTWSWDAETRKNAREERQAILGFKQAVYILEEDVEQFQAIATNMKSYNPLTPYAGLLFGGCAFIISIMWFIHIAVYVFPSPPLAPFLNNYFSWFDSWFPLFGVLSVLIFTMYLLFAAVKGAFKFGLRFLCFHIHPMKVGKTYMSSFMFNMGLILLCALPVVQFSQLAFSDYASFTTIRQIYGVQIQYLKFFSWFWKTLFFVYCFFTICCLTAIYLARQPRDPAASGQALRDRLRANAATQSSSLPPRKGKSDAE